MDIGHLEGKLHETHRGTRLGINIMGVITPDLIPPDMIPPKLLSMDYDCLEYLSHPVPGFHSTSPDKTPSLIINSYENKQYLIPIYKRDNIPLKRETDFK